MFGYQYFLKLKNIKDSLNGKKKNISHNHDSYNVQIWQIGIIIIYLLHYYMYFAIAYKN